MAGLTEYDPTIHRWPVILTGAIDDVHRAVSLCKDEEKAQEGKGFVEKLARLKYEVQHDRALSPLDDDGQPDIEGYNAELATFENPKWLGVPWLFLECYLYRRIATYFALSKYWKSHDVFSLQKISTFKSSRPAVIELASRYRAIHEQLASQTNATSQTSDENAAAEKLLFTEICEICLWGNATDLSLLTSLTYADIQKLQGSEARKSAEKNIIANDLPQAFELLKAVQASPRSESGDRRVDIVLDNAGFELYVDLILAGYLIEAGLATHIVLHPKNIPWFVSDVIPNDFAQLLQAVADPQAFYSSLSDDEKHSDQSPTPLSDKETTDLQFMFKHWSQLHAEGKLTIRSNLFWTEGGSYWRLPHSAPALLKDLQESELVIFKGDLNYRKLTGDVAWSPTTPFVDAIGPLGKGSGLRVLALRTCKADVVVGLEEGLDEKLRIAEGGGGDTGQRKWAWSGKWAVVQMFDGKGQ
ncbi:hypothetical protein MMC25_000497 [Agyrium rufum]|nr:hypothetical protein [Agyrium rufum]